jgi:hypothetical protein
MSVWSFVPQEFQTRGKFLRWPPGVPAAIRADPVWQNLLETEGADAIARRLGIQGTTQSNVAPNDANRADSIPEISDADRLDAERVVAELLGRRRGR